MKEKLKLSKSQVMTIVMSAVVAIIFSIGTSYASNSYLYNSSDVSYDNTVSGIVATDVQGAVDELYFHATDYSGINTRVTSLETNYSGIDTRLTSVENTFLNKTYPVGSIYISINNTNPSTLFGGTWDSFGTGRTLVGVDTSQTEFNTIEKTGGNKTHNHTLDSGYAKFTAFSSNIAAYSEKNGVPSWTASYQFTITNPNSSTKTSTWGANLGGNTDNGSSLQPYITVYMWKRTA